MEKEINTYILTTYGLVCFEVLSLISSSSFFKIRTRSIH